MYFKTRYFIILFFVFFSVFRVFGQDERELFREGVQNAKAGNNDFALSYFNTIVKSTPDSIFLPDALFASGEYYIMNGYGSLARETFGLYIKESASRKERQPAGKIFAFYHLLRLARGEKNEILAKQMEGEILKACQVSLFFRNYKEYKYKSGFCRRYKAVYFIDRVEIYIDDKLSEKINF